MSLILVGVIVLIGLFYFYVKNKHSYWKNLKVKHLKPSFLTGHFPFYPRTAFTDIITTNYSAFPASRYVGLYLFMRPAILLRDPDLIKDITVKHFDHFVDHNSVIGDTDIDPIWTRNLFARTGDNWRKMRGILSPSFTLSKMKTIFTLINDVATNFTKFYEAKNGIIEIDAKDIMSRVANDVIATTAFGLDVDSVKEPNNSFYLTGKDLTDFSGWKLLKFFVPAFSTTLTKILKLKIVNEDVGKYFTEIIENAINAREKQGIVRPDMIQLLLEAKKKQAVDDGKEKLQLTNDDIVSQAMIFFFAGFDTISTVLAFTLYEIAIAEDIQERLYQEVLEQPEELSYEAVQGMKYLDMVVAESLRKWPGAPVLDRIVTKPFTIEPVEADERPIDLKMGDLVWIPTWSIQRDSQYFPDPEKFDPERFNEENKDKIVPGSYAPFGVGPRMCIGNRFALLEMKTVLFHLIKKFQLVKTDRTSSQIKIDPNTGNLAALGGIWIGLKLREKVDAKY